MSQKIKLKIRFKTKKTILTNLKVRKESRKKTINLLLKKISFMDLRVTLKNTFMEDRR